MKVVARGCIRIATAALWIRLRISTAGKSWVYPSSLWSEVKCDVVDSCCACWFLSVLHCFWPALPHCSFLVCASSHGCNSYFWCWICYYFYGSLICYYYFLLHYSTLTPPSIPSSLQITYRSFQYASRHFWNQLPASLCQPLTYLSNSASSSSLSGTFSISSIDSPLSSSITPSLFHSRLNIFLFCKSFLP